MNKYLKKQNLLVAISRTMTPDERERFADKLFQLLNGDIKTLHEECKTEAVLKCRRCGKTVIVKYGKDKNGKQRYKCKFCRSIFISNSFSATARTRQGLSVWKIFIQSILNDLPLAKCAQNCDFSIGTAYIWRRKLFNTFSEADLKQLDNQELSPTLLH